MSSPFFSVIMPVYNKEAHLIRALDSIKKQTFQDLEIIVVCDPSTDNSNQVVEQYESDKIRIFYRDEPGAGGYAARNLGIDNAKGEWISFLDADDEWLPNHLEKVHELATKYPDVSVIGAGWKSIGNKGESMDKYSRNFHQLGVHEVSLERYLKQGLHGKRPIHTSVASIKNHSPINQELFIIHAEIKRGGDLYAWLKLLNHYKKMLWSDHLGANYYTNATNMVTKSAPSTAYLMGAERLEALQKGVSKEAQKLLQQYFNRWLRNDWKSNIHRGCENYSLGSKMYWKGDRLYATILYITTVWPQNLRKWLGGSGVKDR